MRDRAELMGEVIYELDPTGHRNRNEVLMVEILLDIRDLMKERNDRLIILPVPDSWDGSRVNDLVDSLCQEIRRRSERGQPLLRKEGSREDFPSGDVPGAVGFTPGVPGS